MKKFLTILLALVMMVSLVACGDGKKKTESTKADEEAAATTAEAEKPDETTPAENKTETEKETKAEKEDKKADEGEAKEDEEEIKVLRLGAVPGEQVDNIKEKYAPLVDYLSRTLGIETELFVGTDYTATIEAMRAKKLDVAWFGPFSYVLAADMANAEAFAFEYQTGRGTYYNAYIITKADSDINEIKDLKDKTFAFVDPASTGGYLIPVKEMKAAGFDPEKDLKSSTFLGGHDACALAVVNNQVDAAAIVKHHFEKCIEEGLFKEEDVKIIHVSDPFPAGPIAWRKDIPEELKAKLKDAFINMPEEEFDKLGGMVAKIDRFVEAKDPDFDVLREAAGVLDLDLTKMN